MYTNWLCERRVLAPRSLYCTLVDWSVDPSRIFTVDVFVVHHEWIGNETIIEYLVNWFHNQTCNAYILGFSKKGDNKLFVYIGKSTSIT